MDLAGVSVSTIGEQAVELDLSQRRPVAEQGTQPTFHRSVAMC